MSNLQNTLKANCRRGVTWFVLVCLLSSNIPPNYRNENTLAPQTALPIQTRLSQEQAASGLRSLFQKLEAQPLQERAETLSQKEDVLIPSERLAVIRNTKGKKKESLVPTYVQNNTYIRLQAKNLIQCMQELLANAQDTNLERYLREKHRNLSETELSKIVKTIGRFGRGALQVFGELQKDGDAVVVESRKRGTDKVVTFFFYQENNEIVFHEEEALDISQYPGDEFKEGTKISVLKKLNHKEIEERFESLREAFHFSVRTPIEMHVAGKKIDSIFDAPEFQFLGDASMNQISSEVEKVRVVITTQGYFIRDDGMGLDSEELREKLLKPTSGGKDIPSLDRNEEIRQTLIRIQPQTETDKDPTVHAWLNGRQVFSFPVEKVKKIASEFHFTFPPNVSTTAGWNNLQTDQIALRALETMIDKVLELEVEIEHREEMIQGLVDLIEYLLPKARRQVEKIKGKDAMEYLKEKTLLWLDSLTQPLLVVPNKASWGNIDFKGKVIYISPKLISAEATLFNQFRLMSLKEKTRLGIPPYVRCFVGKVEEESPTTLISGKDQQGQWILLDETAVQENAPEILVQEQVEKTAQNDLYAPTRQRSVVPSLRRSRSYFNTLMGWFFLFISVLMMTSSNVNATRTPTKAIASKPSIEKRLKQKPQLAEAMPVVGRQTEYIPGSSGFNEEESEGAARSERRKLYEISDVLVSTQPPSDADYIDVTRLKRAILRFFITHDSPEIQKALQKKAPSQDAIDHLDTFLRLKLSPEEYNSFVDKFFESIFKDLKDSEIDQLVELIRSQDALAKEFSKTLQKVAVKKGKSDDLNKILDMVAGNTSSNWNYWKSPEAKLMLEIAAVTLSDQNVLKRKAIFTSHFLSVFEKKLSKLDAIRDVFQTSFKDQKLYSQEDKNVWERFEKLTLFGLGSKEHKGFRTFLRTSLNQYINAYYLRKMFEEKIPKELLSKEGTEEYRIYQILRPKHFSDSLSSVEQTKVIDFIIARPDLHGPFAKVFSSDFSRIHRVKGKAVTSVKALLLNVKKAAAEDSKKRFKIFTYLLSTYPELLPLIEKIPFSKDWGWYSVKDAHKKWIEKRIKEKLASIDPAPTDSPKALKKWAEYFLSKEGKVQWNKFSQAIDLSKLVSSKDLVRGVFLQEKIDFKSKFQKGPFDSMLKEILENPSSFWHSFYELLWRERWELNYSSQIAQTIRKYNENKFDKISKKEKKTLYRFILKEKKVHSKIKLSFTDQLTKELNSLFGLSYYYKHGIDKAKIKATREEVDRLFFSEPSEEILSILQLVKEDKEIVSRILKASHDAEWRNKTLESSFLEETLPLFHSLSLRVPMLRQALSDDHATEVRNKLIKRMVKPATSSYSVDDFNYQKWRPFMKALILSGFSSHEAKAQLMQALFLKRVKKREYGDETISMLERLTKNRGGFDWFPKQTELGLVQDSARTSIKQGMSLPQIQFNFSPLPRKRYEGSGSRATSKRELPLSSKTFFVTQSYVELKANGALNRKPKYNYGTKVIAEMVLTSGFFDVNEDDDIPIIFPINGDVAGYELLNKKGEMVQEGRGNRQSISVDQPGYFQMKWKVQLNETFYKYIELERERRIPESELADFERFFGPEFLRLTGKTLEQLREADEMVRFRAIHQVMWNLFSYDAAAPYLYNGKSWSSTFAQLPKDDDGRAGLVCNGTTLFPLIAGNSLGLEVIYHLGTLNNKDGGFYTDQVGHTQASIKINGQWEIIETTTLVPTKNATIPKANIRSIFDKAGPSSKTFPSSLRWIDSFLNSDLGGAFYYLKKITSEKYIRSHKHGFPLLLLKIILMILPFIFAALFLKFIISNFYFFIFLIKSFIKSFHRVIPKEIFQETSEQDLLVVDIKTSKTPLRGIYKKGTLLYPLNEDESLIQVFNVDSFVFASLLEISTGVSKFYRFNSSGDKVELHDLSQILEETKTFDVDQGRVDFSSPAYLTGTLKGQTALVRLNPDGTVTRRLKPNLDIREKKMALEWVVGLPKLKKPLLVYRTRNEYLFYHDGGDVVSFARGVSSEKGVVDKRYGALLRGTEGPLIKEDTLFYALPIFRKDGSKGWDIIQIDDLGRIKKLDFPLDFEFRSDLLPQLKERLPEFEDESDYLPKEPDLTVEKSNERFNTDSFSNLPYPSGEGISSFFRSNSSDDNQSLFIYQGNNHFKEIPGFFNGIDSDVYVLKERLYYVSEDMIKSLDLKGQTREHMKKPEVFSFGANVKDLGNQHVTRYSTDSTSADILSLSSQKVSHTRVGLEDLNLPADKPEPTIKVHQIKSIKLPDGEYGVLVNINLLFGKRETQSHLFLLKENEKIKLTPPLDGDWTFELIYGENPYVKLYREQTVFREIPPLYKLIVDFFSDVNMTHFIALTATTTSVFVFSVSPYLIFVVFFAIIFLSILKQYKTLYSRKKVAIAPYHLIALPKDEPPYNVVERCFGKGASLERAPMLHKQNMNGKDIISSWIKKKWEPLRFRLFQNGQSVLFETSHINLSENLKKFQNYSPLFSNLSQTEKSILDIQLSQTPRWNLFHFSTAYRIYLVSDEELLDDWENQLKQLLLTRDNRVAQQEYWVMSHILISKVKNPREIYKTWQRLPREAKETILAQIQFTSDWGEPNFRNAQAERFFSALADESFLQGLSEEKQVYIRILQGHEEFILREESPYSHDPALESTLLSKEEVLLDSDPERSLAKLLVIGNKKRQLTDLGELDATLKSEIMELDSAKTSLDESKNQVKLVKTVFSQDKKNRLWIREWIQNARDVVIENETETQEVKMRSFTQEGKWIVSVSDPVGMNLSLIVQYLLNPDASTKRDRALDQKQVDGMFGQGFFTGFASASQIRVLSGINGKVYDFRLQPIYDKEENIKDIRLISATAYKGNYKGTTVQWINDLGDKSEIDSEGRRHLSRANAMVENGFIRYLLQKYCGTLPNVNLTWNGKKINEPFNVVASTPHPDETLDKIELLKMTEDLYGFQRVSVNHLYVSRIEEDLLGSADIPYWLKQLLIERKLNINFPSGTPVIRSRTALSSPSSYQDHIKTLLFIWALDLYEKGQLSIPGLPPHKEWVNNPTLYSLETVDKSLYPLLTFSTKDHDSLLDQQVKVESINEINLRQIEDPFIEAFVAVMRNIYKKALEQERNHQGLVLVWNEQELLRELVHFQNYVESSNQDYLEKMALFIVNKLSHKSNRLIIERLSHFIKDPQFLNEQGAVIASILQRDKTTEAQKKWRSILAFQVDKKWILPFQYEDRVYPSLDELVLNPKTEAELLERLGKLNSDIRSRIKRWYENQVSRVPSAEFLPHSLDDPPNLPQPNSPIETAA